MIRVESFERQLVGGTALEAAIIALDTTNMGPIFERLGQPLPIDRRRLAFAERGTLVCAFGEGDSLLGYIEYGPALKQPNGCYVSSIQLAEQCRGSCVLLILLRHTLTHCTLAPGTILYTDVQETNRHAILFLERLGFIVDASSARRGTMSATATFPIRLSRTRNVRSKNEANKTDADNGS